MDIQLEQQARRTIARYGMLSSGGAVIAALSGGADSMALLSFLYRCRIEYGIRLSAAHVNHGLRGEEADRDEAFVRKVCGEWGIPIRVLQADVRAEAAKTGESEEECGRRLRYAFFESIDPEAWIATAHTRSDCVETMLFHLARGTALRGLCGIPPVNGRRIRPLIECTRRQVEDYCAGQNLLFVMDSTNFSCAYTRNQIRLSILPMLRQVNPEFEAAAARCMDTLREEDAFLSEVALETVQRSETRGGFFVEPLRQAKRPIRRRALHHILSRLAGQMVEASHLDAVERLLDAGGQVQVAGGLMVRVRRGLLEFPGLHPGLAPWTVPVGPHGATLPHGTLHLTLVHKKDSTDTQKINKQMLANALDCDRIIGNVLATSRKEGDIFHPAGRKCGKSLKKLFQENAVAPEKRNETVILCDEAGILFVEGFGPDCRAAVGPQAQRLLLIEITH